MYAFGNRKITANNFKNDHLSKFRCLTAELKLYIRYYVICKGVLLAKVELHSGTNNNIHALPLLFEIEYKAYNV